MTIKFGDPRLPDRFWDKCRVDPATECWVTTGHIDRFGYGRITLNGRQDSKHRVSYEYLVGEIPSGLVIDHLCRVRSCCNPAHLEPVTNKVNIERGVHATKTHCKHGHAFDFANTHWETRGMLRKRSCRKCSVRRVAQSVARRTG